MVTLIFTDFEGNEEHYECDRYRIQGAERLVVLWKQGVDGDYGHTWIAYENFVSFRIEK